VVSTVVADDNELVRWPR